MFRALSVQIYGTESMHLKVRASLVTHLVYKADQNTMALEEVTRTSKLINSDVRLKNAEMREIPFALEKHLLIYTAENGGNFAQFTLKSNNAKDEKLRVFQNTAGKKTYYSAIIEKPDNLFLTLVI